MTSWNKRYLWNISYGGICYNASHWSSSLNCTEPVFVSSNKLRGSLWHSVFKQLAGIEIRCLGTENYLFLCRFSVTNYVPHNNGNLQNKQCETSSPILAKVLPHHKPIKKCFYAEVGLQQPKKNNTFGMCSAPKKTKPNPTQLPSTVHSFTEVHQFTLYVLVGVFVVLHYVFYALVSEDWKFFFMSLCDKFVFMSLCDKISNFILWLSAALVAKMLPKDIQWS